MLKIGVYGGAFNPPHNGHVNAVRTAIAGLALDKVLVIPTGRSPHKEQPDGSPSAQDRLRMTQLAFADMEQVEVLDVEIKRSGPNYTVNTLYELCDLYPDDDFWLITGSDMFLSIHTWRHPEEIFTLCRICALSRKGGDKEELMKQAYYLLERYGAGCEVLENEAIEISSTDVREAIPKGKAGGYLPGNVLEYIHAKGLYNE